MNSDEKIKLNHELFEQCIKEKIDSNKIKELLNKGAEPLGRMDEYDSNVYGDLIYEIYDKQNLFEITKLFLENGMKIKHSDFRNDGNDIDPLWHLTFACNEEGIKTLQLLLEYNTDWSSIEEFVNHTYEDFWIVDDPTTEEYAIGFPYALKMLMLCATYPYILEKINYLRNVLKIDKNNYDIANFRQYNDYIVQDNLEKAIIIEKKTGKTVWEIVYGE